MKPTHNPQFLQSLRWRANAQNVSFFTLYGGQFTFSLNSVVNTKLPTKFLLNEREGRTGTRSWGVMSIARSVQKLPRNGSSKRGLSSSLLYAARTQLAHFFFLLKVFRSPEFKGLVPWHVFDDVSNSEKKIVHEFQTDLFNEKSEWI